MWLFLIERASPLLLRTKPSGRNIVREEERVTALLDCQATHRQTRSKAYSAWANMKQRCTNPKNRNYHNYGGRGIKICERWLDFLNFYVDMGDALFPGAELDRIDNNGIYEPHNVRWISHQTNTQNTRRNIYVQYNNEELCLTEACRRAGLYFSAVRARSKRKSISVQESFDFYLKRITSE